MPRLKNHKDQGDFKGYSNPFSFRSHFTCKENNTFRLLWRRWHKKVEGETLNISTLSVSQTFPHLNPHLMPLRINIQTLHLHL